MYKTAVPFYAQSIWPEEGQCQDAPYGDTFETSLGCRSILGQGGVIPVSCHQIVPWHHHDVGWCLARFYNQLLYTLLYALSLTQIASYAIYDADCNSAHMCIDAYAAG